MCGIGGFLRVWPAERRDEALATPHARALPGEWLSFMDAHLAHRGPDGLGTFRDRVLARDGRVVDVALVHRRLAIIDPAGGVQPMLLGAHGRLMGVEERDARTRATLDGVVGEGPRPPAVVFNGCIYNHRELRRELVSMGHAFGTDHSDTEVLLHGWRAWGVRLFERLVGMFALALWDGGDGQRGPTLTLARDRFGEKPLYTASFPGDPAEPSAPDDRLILFSSAHAPLAKWAARSGAPIGLRQQSGGLDEWLRFGFGRGTPGAFTSQVPPSTWRTLGVIPDSREISLSGGHGPMLAGDRPAFPRREHPLTPGQAEGLIVRSVEARLEADVELGCFLSGGVDSTVIAAVAQGHLARHGRKLRTFTVRMPDGRYDESGPAAAVARALGTRHTTLECRPDPASDLTNLISQLGLPFGDSSLLPAAWLSRSVREAGIKVALSGDGGDELFVGYERYRAAEWLHRRRGLIAMLPGRLLPRHDPRSWTTKLARLVEAASGLGYPELVSIFPSGMLRELLGRRERPGASGAPWAWLGMSSAVAWDLGHYLPEDLLRKTDTASMAFALEVRCPFLDPALALACLEAPLKDLVSRAQLKRMLRTIAGRFVDPALIDRPKMGFAVPIGEWFRTDHGGLRTMLLDHLRSTEPFGPPALGINLNMRYIHRLLDEHLGTGPSGQVRMDHGQRLYLLLATSIWAKSLG